MNQHVRAFIKQAIGAGAISFTEKVQSLWSGYGAIDRYALEDSDIHSVIVKHIKTSNDMRHPRGWNSDISHQRKLKSYQVETYWYRHYASQCDNHCRIPECLASETGDAELLLLLEDLDDSGLPVRLNSASLQQANVCLQWLAFFHARFMGHPPQGLWQSGTYWHLQTRPDELAAMNDEALRQAAGKLDQLLQQTPYLTFVHGDAKLANFCFSANTETVAAVDFQYVGGGCGMKDVAYFIGSCFHEEDCERYAQTLLDNYFRFLDQALKHYQSAFKPDDIEKSWRPLYAIAWTDFHRFLKGWCPEHGKINSYSERLAKDVLKHL